MTINIRHNALISLLDEWLYKNALSLTKSIVKWNHIFKNILFMLCKFKKNYFYQHSFRLYKLFYTVVKSNFFVYSYI